jgi:hypothetical protein
MRHAGAIVKNYGRGEMRQRFQRFSSMAKDYIGIYRLLHMPSGAREPEKSNLRRIPRI